MAKGKGKGRSKSKGRSKGKRGKGKGGKKAKGQIPIDVLEKRLGKLNNLVARRGGSAY